MTTHYKSNTREYSAWMKIKMICYKPKTISYKNFGAKGIGMCEEWKNDFSKFFEDMGPIPEGKNGIELIDKTKDFSKDNCMWVSKVRGRKSAPKELGELKKKDPLKIKNPKTISLIIENELYEFIRKQSLMKSLETGLHFHVNDLIREALKKSFPILSQTDLLGCKR